MAYDRYPQVIKNIAKGYFSRPSGGSEEDRRNRATRDSEDFGARGSREKTSSAWIAVPRAYFPRDRAPPL